MNLVGTEYKLSYKNQHCIIAELGAVIKKYAIDGLDIITSFENKLPASYQGCVLFPFPNRLENGRYKFNGKKYQLPINEIDRNNQLHGFVNIYKFNCLKKSKSSITLELKLPQMMVIHF